MSQTKSLCLLIAMKDEAKPLIETLGLSIAKLKTPLSLPCEMYQGRYKNLQLSIVTYGLDSRYDVDFIGPVPAALTSMKICELLEPELVISCGTAGGFKNKGANIGTVYLSSEKCIFHDRRIPLPGFQESGIGHYPVLNIDRMAEQLKLPKGIVSSGSSLERDERDLAIMTKFGAVAKEMEAASIALVCSLQEIPFFCVKSITNLLDSPDTSESQFQSNFSQSVSSLHNQMIRVLNYCNDNRLSADGI